MKVRSLAWLGVRTKHAGPMSAFLRDVLRLELLPEQPSGTRFRLADGTEVHVYDGDDSDHDFFGGGPVVGFQVEPFEAVRRAMIEHGIEFVYPEPQRQNGRVWQHFRAPDGNVYEIMGDEERAPAQAPTLLFVVGAPAVGKMTVGEEIARLTGLKLFHNHLSIEPVLRFFDFGTPAFTRLVKEFRRGVLEETAKSELPGLIFTFVWAFDLPSDAVAVEAYAAPFRERGGRVLFVELVASLEERLRRNVGESRLAEKPSKRDVEGSRKRLLEHEAKYRFTSDEEYTRREDWLRIDTTELQPTEVAELVVRRFPALGSKV